ncbi:ATP synthase F0 [Seiridium cupressi]
MDVLETTNPERCIQLSTPAIPQFVVSCLLMGWLLLSYIPQWARIVTRKSAEGLSTFYILLGSLSGVCAVGNILMLPSTEADMGCCTVNSRFACISGLFGTFQVIFGVACFWVVLFMYVYFSEEEYNAEIHGRRMSWSGPERTFRRAKRAWIVLLAVCGFAFAILVASATILNRFRSISQTWADILGVSVAVLACVQWIPQTLTTWSLQSLGSLSLVSLLLMAPYTWIFAINMVIRVGIAGWSAWIVYILVGTMQLILIIMGIGFAIRDWKNPPEDPRASRATLQADFNGWNGSRRSFASSQIAPDERRPLLADRKRPSDQPSTASIAQSPMRR